jgi:hypothetical protein
MSTDDANTRHHEEAKTLFHHLARLGGSAYKLGKFVDSVYFMRSYNGMTPTAIENVQVTCVQLLAAFNGPSGPRALGFDVNGKLPFCMVVADIFGKQMAFHSASIAIVREICCSAYGAIERNSERGRVLRHSIDEMAAHAKASDATLCLVYSTPWGTAVQDRFWRLMTVRRTDDGKYVDSERVMTSLSLPPAKEGRSVLGEEGPNFKDPHAADRLRSVWFARGIDASDAIADPTCDPTAATPHAAATSVPTTNLDAAATPSAQATRAVEQKLRVCTDVIKGLREREREMQTIIDAMRSEMDTLIEAGVRKRIQDAVNQREADNYNLGIELECQRLENTVLRVQNETVRRELFHVDRVQLPAMQIARESHDAAADTDRRKLAARVTELQAQLLVAEDEVKKGGVRLAQRRQQDARLRTERAKADATLDEQAREISRLSVELEEQTRRADDAKRAASEQLAAAVDAKADARRATLAHRDAMGELKRDHADALESALDGLHAARASLAEARVERDAVHSKAAAMAARATELCAAKQRACRALERTAGHAFVLGLRLMRAQAVAKTETAKATEAAKAATAVPPPLPPGAPPPTPMPSEQMWNVVASAKGLIRMAERFVDVAQSNGSGSLEVAAPQHQSHQGYHSQPHYGPPHSPDPSTTRHATAHSPTPMQAVPPNHGNPNFYHQPVFYPQQFFTDRNNDMFHNQVTTTLPILQIQPLMQPTPVMAGGHATAAPITNNMPMPTGAPATPPQSTPPEASEAHGVANGHAAVIAAQRGTNRRCKR